MHGCCLPYYLWLTDTSLIGLSIYIQPDSPLWLCRLLQLTRSPDKDRKPSLQGSGPGANGSPLPLLYLKRASLREFMAAWPPASGLENLAASVLHKKGKCIHYYYIIIQCIIYNSDYAVSSQSLWPQIRGWGDINPPSEVFGGSTWRWEDSTPSIKGALSEDFLPQATLEVEFGGGDWGDLDKQYLVYVGYDAGKVSTASSELWNANSSHPCPGWRQMRSDPEACKEWRGSLQLLGSDSLLKTWPAWVSLSAFLAYIGVFV